MRVLSVMLFSALASLVAGVTPVAHAGTIDFTDGEGDVTFYFQRQAQTWHVVFREKAETEATGLDTPFTGFSGIVGLGSDYVFQSLTTNIATSTSVNVGGTDYIVSSADGSPVFDEGTADLGIRMRLREDFGSVVNQFDSFNIGLNVGGSTYNGSPLGLSGKHVSLLGWDLLNNIVPEIDTAGGLFSANYTNWGHFHRHWGFSDYGTYDLVFNIQGVGGAFGNTSAPGSFRMKFVVSVPEPSSLLLMGMSVGGFAFWRRRSV